MIRLGNRMIAVAAFAVIATLGTAQSAYAFLRLSVQTASYNGGAMTEIATASDFSSLSFTGPLGNFSVSVLGGASNDGLFGGTFSNLLHSTTSVTNNSASADTITFYMTQADYTQPVGSLLAVESSLGGSINNGSLDLTNMFQAYADAGNNIYGLSDFTNGPQTGIATGSSYSTGSVNGLFSRTGNYSLTSVVTFSMGGSSIANYSSQINVRPTPAPAGLVLAFTGLPVIGLRYLVRRRRS